MCSPSRKLVTGIFAATKPSTIPKNSPELAYQSAKRQVCGKAAQSNHADWRRCCNCRCRLNRGSSTCQRIHHYGHSHTDSPAGHDTSRQDSCTGTQTTFSPKLKNLHNLPWGLLLSRERTLNGRVFTGAMCHSSELFNTDGFSSHLVAVKERSLTESRSDTNLDWRCSHSQKRLAERI